MPAAYLALEDVNNKKDLLPDFELTLHSNDSEVGGKQNQFRYVRPKSISHLTLSRWKNIAQHTRPTGKTFFAYQTRLDYWYVERKVSDSHLDI